MNVIARLEFELAWYDIEVCTLAIYSSEFSEELRSKKKKKKKGQIDPRSKLTDCFISSKKRRLEIVNRVNGDYDKYYYFLRVQQASKCVRVWFCFAYFLAFIFIY